MFNIEFVHLRTLSPAIFSPFRSANVLRVTLESRTFGILARRILLFLGYTRAPLFSKNTDTSIASTDLIKQTLAGVKHRPSCVCQQSAPRFGANPMPARLGLVISKAQQLEGWLLTVSLKHSENTLAIWRHWCQTYLDAVEFLCYSGLLSMCSIPQAVGWSRFSG